MPGVVETITERTFETLSAGRGSRIFHPQGIAFRATVRVDDEAPLPPGEHDAVARLSRGLGLVRGWPEFLGLALRIGEHQDLLFASSRPSPLVRMAPLPARSFFGTTLSSLLPFDAGDRVVFVGALVHGAPTGDDDQLTELANAPGPVTATLALAELGGRWRPFGTLEVGERLPDV